MYPLGQITTNKQQKVELQNTLIDNRYSIQRILGQGSNSRTYLASDTHRFNEQCVLKEFTPFDVEPSKLEQFRHLFQKEAKRLHQISHPQIPQLLACFEGQGRLFLVQEYISGQSYSALLEERQQEKKVFQESEIVRWLKDILLILDYIHQLGIIHGDISPNNVIQIPEESLPFLVDFGVRKLIHKHQHTYHNSLQKHSFVKTISFVGKLGYAPREQIVLNHCFPSSDLYSLGVTALVLLTGKSPTTLLDRSSLEWQWEYVRASHNLTAILSRMTAEKPKERYQSAKQVLQDLTQYYPDLDSSEADTIISVSASSSKAQKSPTTNSTSSNFPQSPNQSIDDRTIILAPSASVSPDPKIKETLIINQIDSTSSDLDSRSIDRKSLKSSKIDPTIIISPVHVTSQGKLSPEFIKRCEEELFYFVGGIASVTVREAMESQKPQSPEELINALVQYISDKNQAKKFKQILLNV